MSHAEHHHHHHGIRRVNSRPLLISLCLTATYMVAEIVGGLMSNSLALLADAGHMATDVAALALAVFAMWLARRPQTVTQSFGFYRAEVLAALINAAVLMIISLGIFIEAFKRLNEPPHIDSTIMLTVAIGGLAINLIAAWILSKDGDHEHNLNTRGAYLHVMGDAFGSVAAIVAAIVMISTGWYLADPILSAAIGFLVLWSSWRLMSESIHVLLESTPKGINPSQIAQSLATVEGVAGVHDLHIWTVTSGIHALSGHVEIKPNHHWRHVIPVCNKALREQFNITHATLQPESASDHCDVEDGCPLDPHKTGGQAHAH